MMKCGEMYKRFKAAVDTLITQDSPVLLALSGGSDSVLMLLLFGRLRKERGTELHALHVHHGLRGEEADRDEAFAKALCQKNKIPYRCVYADVKAYSAKEKKSIEESARILRYKALEEESARLGNAYIATAHNADDRLETMIFRMVRGSGNAGIGGIPEKRGTIIRPMLQFTKAEIEKYLNECGQEFVFDSTNGERDCSRNKIRLDVLPVLREICPAAAENAARFAKNAEEDERLLQSLVPDGKLSAKELQSLPLPLLKRYVMRRFGKEGKDISTGADSLEEVHLRDICGVISEGVYGKSVSLPGRIRLTYDAEGIHFSKDREKKNGYRVVLRHGENAIPDENISVYLMDPKEFDEFCGKNEKVHNLFMKTALDSATIEGGLYVRQKAVGDKLYFGGMTRSVSKLVAESCKNAEARKRFPIVCDEKGVLWVPGHRAREGCDAGKQPEGEKIYIMMGEKSHGNS